MQKHDKMVALAKEKSAEMTLTALLKKMRLKNNQSITQFVNCQKSFLKKEQN